MGKPKVKIKEEILEEDSKHIEDEDNNEHQTDVKRKDETVNQEKIGKPKVKMKEN